MVTPMLSPALSLLLLVFPGSGCRESVTALAAAPEGEFEALWYDGQAEVAGYTWSGSRYGQMRSGEAVAIFVTEPLGALTHVKLDDPSKGSEPAITVMKLNLVRDFQTGIYDYNTMTSVFSDVAAFAPLKVSFSSAEWCGHVYEELDARARELKLDVRSYFQGESEQRSLPARPGSLLGDHLLVWLRGLRGHVLAPGASRTFPYLADAFERRLRHAPATWGEVTLSRDEREAEVTVPAGTFRAVVVHARTSDGREGVFHVEEAYPHHLLSWRWSRGDEVLDAGEMTGARRIEYWKLHDEGHESLRGELGLGNPAATPSSPRNLHPR